MKYSSFITYQRIVFVLPCLIQISNINLNQASKDICKHQKNTDERKPSKTKFISRTIKKHSYSILVRRNGWLLPQNTNEDFCHSFLLNVKLLPDLLHNSAIFSIHENSKYWNNFSLWKKFNWNLNNWSTSNVV